MRAPEALNPYGKKQPVEDPKGRELKVATGTGGVSQARFLDLTFCDNKKALKNFSIEEISSHNKEDDCWVILDNQVYDITQYLSFHPGGREILLELAGEDVSEAFIQYHPWVNGHLILKNVHLGSVLNDA